MLDEYEDDVFCEVCGRNLNEDVSGCPACNPCGGLYAPGTEECDWCEYSDDCSSLVEQKLKREGGDE